MICDAIAKDAVAPGLGALRTCICLPVLIILKSICSFPSREIACARTPDGQVSNMEASTSGIIF